MIFNKIIFLYSKRDFIFTAEFDFILFKNFEFEYIDLKASYIYFLNLEIISNEKKIKMVSILNSGASLTHPAGD